MTDQRHNWIKSFVKSKTPYYLFDKSDDIVQDVMIKLLRADQKKGVIITNYGYLKQTAMSVMIDYIRKHKTRISLEDNLDESALSVTEFERNQDSPESCFENQWLLEKVYQVINGFSKQKQTTILLYLRGLKIREIAALTGCGVAKVRNDVYRGKNEIIAQLKSMGVSYEC